MENNFDIIFYLIILFLVYLLFTVAKKRLHASKDREEKYSLELSQANEELRFNSDKYRELVENANSIILRMDVEGKITFVNEFAQEFFGFKEDEILGRSVIGTIVPQTDTSGHDLKLMIADIMIHPQKYINNENENMLHSGKRVWIAWTNKPVLGNNGKLTEVLCIGNDITRTKQAEEELLKTKELAEAASRAGTIVCAPDWRIKEANAAARKYFSQGLNENADLLQIMSQGYSSSLSIEEIADLTAAFKTFVLVRPETEKTKALYLQVNMEVLTSQLHEAESIILVFQDITSIRTAEVMKQDFLSLVSHKLRTPAAVIAGHVDMLRDEDILGPLNNNQKKAVDAILKQSSQLTNLIDKLLKFTEINRTRTDLTKEKINLCEYLPSLLAPFTDGTAAKKIELNIDCPGADSGIFINKPTLDIIISDLVENAIKFNDKEAVKVSISARKHGKDVTIMISDNGPGIPPEEQERIFSKFYQIEKNFTGNVEGIGLGLGLVKRLVDACGGKIDLKSEIGKGASFKITLPS